MSETRTHWSPKAAELPPAPSANGEATYDFSKVHVTSFDFEDLKPIEIPVRYRGQRYVLREASGGAVIAHDAARMRAIRMDDGKMIGMGDGAAEADLIALSFCLCLADGEGQILYTSGPKPVPRTVPLDELRLWPDRVTDPLTKEMKKISPGLSDKAADTDEIIAAEQRLLDDRKAKHVKAKKAGVDDEGKGS